MDQHQKTYQLQAQTPMVHFQWREKDACLRATEVKPKLDRFVIARCGGSVPSSWTTAGQEGALQYKMQIIPGERHREAAALSAEDCKIFYFGNMGATEEEKKELVFRHCEMKIICFIPELLEKIDALIGEFFALHNFGCRQTKGFGGFLVMDRSRVEDAIRNSGMPYFYADMPRQPFPESKGRFHAAYHHAVAIYTFLKNGTNQTLYNPEMGRYRFRDRYVKGFAVRAFLPEDTGSDKAFIKSDVLPVEDDESDYDNFTFIRAILGLADHYEFRDYMRNAGVRDTNRGVQYNVQKVHFANFKGTCIRDDKPHFTDVEALKKNEGIKRFASPFLIKIYNDRVYFLLNDSYKLMLDKVFLFSTTEKDLKVDKNRDLAPQIVRLQNLNYLSTPESFDPVDFVRRFVEYFNRERRCLEAFKKTERERTQNPLYYSANLVLREGRPNV